MLDQIIQTKRAQLELVDTKSEIERLTEIATQLPPVRSLALALRSDSDLSVIAEIKKKSPSKGILNAGLDVTSFAREYESGGARAISVLTETDFFDGSLDDLKSVRKAVNIPVLRKDFIISEYQIWESREAGADALLLIATCLNCERLAQLMKVCELAGIEALVEVYTEAELRTALDLKPKLIAVNNRNLRTFEVDLGRMTHLAKKIPNDIVTVSASGVFERSDMIALEKAKVDAVLIGEALVTSANPGQKIRQLLGK